MDAFNTLAPVVKCVTVRLLLVTAFIMNRHIHQLDGSNAFCYANIEDDVYMAPTPDFDLPLGHCFKLEKSLFGLRSSPRSWWKHLDRFIRSLLHFSPCILEPCLCEGDADADGDNDQQYAFSTPASFQGLCASMHTIVSTLL